MATGRLGRFARRSMVALVVSAATVSMSVEARAMGVTPTHVEMVSVGRAAPAQVTVTNDHKTPLPVEITVTRIGLDERGRRSSSPAGESFLVFPPQALIPPGATQVFRLQWVGEPSIARSQSYMIYVNQIPVRPPSGKSVVQLALSMGVLVNVAPPKGDSALRLVGTGIVTEKGRRHPTVTVENPTNVHALLPNGRIRLSAGKWSRVLEASELSTRVGIGLVEPGKRRRFVLPVDLPAGVTQVQASVEHHPSRR